MTPLDALVISLDGRLLPELGQIETARSILAALRQRGLTITPLEPTEAMLGHGCGYTDFMLSDAHDNTPEGHRREMATAYRAMLVAYQAGGEGR